MKRTTIMLPIDLKERAMKHAHKMGISLGELIRISLGTVVDRPEELAGEDPLLSDEAVFDGEVPADLAANHDEHLYGDDA